MDGGGKKLTRRVIANRQSAQRSRLRKLQYISDLESNIKGLNDQVSQLGPQLAFLKAQHAGASHSSHRASFSTQSTALCKTI